MSIIFSDNLSTDVQNQLAQNLQNFQHPTLEKDLLSLNAVKKITKFNDELHIELKMPFPWELGLIALESELDDVFKQLTDTQVIHWHLKAQVATMKRANRMPAVKGVKNIIAVTSGKGGVGKSTVAVNLALGLQALGAKVGILDADIYGPSIPLMLGKQDERPTSPDNKHMTPISAYGVLTNSVGYLVPADSATVWRGPVASGALAQMLNETLWAENGRELDYLVIDMPPGTGDIQLTLSQQIPVTGAIVVTTPQDVALLDAIKGVHMFQKVSIPVLGIVENMSVHICSNCGHHESIFGTGGAEKMAEKYQLNILAKLPLHIQLREDMDKGTPSVVSHPEGEIAQGFLELAQRTAAELYWQGSVIPDEILFTEIK
ncbi:sodium:proton antiporter [Actinobacillus delphinicola]|uniref:iron-sulfur cluster carrier protein ApbC n=1 Tax=Actinobacillus delphinicola TaxID=51161 RepID=UPI00244122A4|nr:iron-sulfur cluster carrier protein ApbC [Actinobacillus delphinicola]MDG6896740.1 sodium:proton antiporter [Actinobacillus delphinicola]